MSESATTSRAIIAEWLRNSAIALVLMISGFAVADLIAAAIGRDVPGSYMFGLMVGLAPFVWFLNRHQKGDLRSWEYVLSAMVFIVADVVCEVLKVDIEIQGALMGVVFFIARAIYLPWIRPRLITSSSA